jgi:hypothetical protein
MECEETPPDNKKFSPFSFFFQIMVFSSSSSSSAVTLVLAPVESATY